MTDCLIVTNASASIANTSRSMIRNVTMDLLNHCIGMELRGSRMTSLSSEHLDTCTDNSETISSSSRLNGSAFDSSTCNSSLRRGSFSTTENGEMPALRRHYSRLRPNTIERYQLSQDLQEKQLEMLMNKYGGQERAQRAVRLIQSKYREYRMKSNFEKMISEKRNSRRIELHRSLMEDANLTKSTGVQLPKSWSVVQPHYPLSKLHRQTLEMLQDVDVVSECGFGGAEVNPKCENKKQLGCDDILVSNDRAFTDWQRSRDEDHNLSIGGDAMVVADQLLTSHRYSYASDNSSHTSSSTGHLAGESSSQTGDSFPELLSKLPPHQQQHTSSTVSGCLAQRTVSNGNIHTSRDSGVDAIEDTSPLSSTEISSSLLTTSMQQTVNYRQANRQLQLLHSDVDAAAAVEPSPIWKRKPSNLDEACQEQASQQKHSNLPAFLYHQIQAAALTAFCENPPPQSQSRQASTPTFSRQRSSDESHHRNCHFRSDKHRKRTYRIGLNLFNKKPDKGIDFLMRRGFIGKSSADVAKFLLYRKGLAKEMIGLYLCSHSQPFNVNVLRHFVSDMDFREKPIDIAVREFCSHFEMKGEAQIIERVLTVFAEHYVRLNAAWVATNLNSADTVLMIAYSILMLNTDLHKNIPCKSFSRMTKEQYVQNLHRAADDVDEDYLRGIYERIASEAMVGGADHVTQVRKVEASLLGRHPPLVEAHRRLVCFCKLFEVIDPTKREKLGSHERAIFLFNDILLVSKVMRSKRKDKSSAYQYRCHFTLVNMSVLLFESPHYKFGVKLVSSMMNPERGLILFNARNEHDRSRFVEDLQESVLEMNEMESLRIEEELSKQARNADMIICQHPSSPNDLVLPAATLNRFSGDSGLQIDFDVNGTTSPAPCCSRNHLV